MQINQKKILAVDDDLFILELISEITASKWELGTCYSGAEALMRIPAYLPDLILLDIVMPGLNGFEVCQQIRSNKRWSNIKIIFVSGRNQTKDIEKAYALGADGYIIKPFGPDELLQYIDSHLMGEFKEEFPVLESCQSVSRCLLSNKQVKTGTEYPIFTV